MVSLFHLLINRNRDRDAFQQKRDRQHPISPIEPFRRMRVSKLLIAFVNGVGSTDAKDKDRGYERPEKAFFAMPERMFFRGRTLIKSQPQQQKDLVCGIGDRVQGFGHHTGGPGYEGREEFHDCYQAVCKERAQYRQHTASSTVEMKAPL